MEDKSKRLTNIIVTGLAEEDPSPSPENNIAKEPSSPPTLVKVWTAHRFKGHPTTRPGEGTRDQPRRSSPMSASSETTPTRKWNTLQMHDKDPVLFSFGSALINRWKQTSCGDCRLSSNPWTSRVYLNDDLTPLDQSRRRTLVPVSRQLRKARVNCEIRPDKLLYEGKSFSITEAEALLKRTAASHAQWDNLETQTAPLNIMAYAQPLSCGSELSKIISLPCAGTMRTSDHRTREKLLPIGSDSESRTVDLAARTRCAKWHPPFGQHSNPGQLFRPCEPWSAGCRVWSSGESK